MPHCATMLLQGIAMQSILHAMVEQGGPPEIDFDFVLVVGHFLTRDENIFTFFEAGPPAFLAHHLKTVSSPCCLLMCRHALFIMTCEPPSAPAVARHVTKVMRPAAAATQLAVAAHEMMLQCTPRGDSAKCSSEPWCAQTQTQPGNAGGEGGHGCGAV